jgi:hypothetical protein
MSELTGPRSAPLRARQREIPIDRSRLCDQPHPDPDNEELAAWKCPWCGLGPGLRGRIQEDPPTDEQRHYGAEPLPADHPARGRSDLPEDHPARMSGTWTVFDSVNR